MGYWLEDADGEWLGDFATNKGIMDLRREGPDSLVEFLDAGEADASLVERVAKDVRGRLDSGYIVGLLKDAKAPVFITDGSGDAEEEKGWKHVTHDQSTHGRRGGGTSEMSYYKPPTGSVFYHGTSEAAAAAILKEGLIPGKGRGADEWAKKKGWGTIEVRAGMEGREASVFMTPSRRIAKQYADRVKELYEVDTGIILKIQVPKGKTLPFKVDLMQPGGLRMEGKIPPGWLTVSKAMAFIHSKSNESVPLPEDQSEAYAVVTVSIAVLIAAAQEEEKG